MTNGLSTCSHGEADSFGNAAPRLQSKMRSNEFALFVVFGLALTACTNSSIHSPARSGNGDGAGASSGARVHIHRGLDGAPLRVTIECSQARSSPGARAIVLETLKLQSDKNGRATLPVAEIRAALKKGWSYSVEDGQARPAPVKIACEGGGSELTDALAPLHPIWDSFPTSVVTSTHASLAAAAAVSLAHTAQALFEAGNAQEARSAVRKCLALPTSNKRCIELETRLDRVAAETAERALADRRLLAAEYELSRCMALVPVSEACARLQLAINEAGIKLRVARMTNVSLTSGRHVFQVAFSLENEFSESVPGEGVLDITGVFEQSVEGAESVFMGIHDVRTSEFQERVIPATGSRATRKALIWTKEIPESEVHVRFSPHPGAGRERFERLASSRKMSVRLRFVDGNRREIVSTGPLVHGSTTP